MRPCGRDPPFADWQKHDDHVNTLAQLPDPTSGAPGAGATDEALVLQTMMMETSETYHVSHYICECVGLQRARAAAPKGQRGVRGMG